GDQHSGVIGSAMVGGEEISVLLTQAPGGKPSVMLYGPMAVGADEIAHGGMIALLELCGQRELAALVQTAVAVRARALIAARGLGRPPAGPVAPPCPAPAACWARGAAREPAP